MARRMGPEAAKNSKHDMHGQTPVTLTPRGCREADSVGVRLCRVWRTDTAERLEEGQGLTTRVAVTLEGTSSMGVDSTDEAGMTVERMHEGKDERDVLLVAHLYSVRKLRAKLLDHCPAWPQPL